jgi:DNA-binding NarL/FixJ family response regulator
MSDWISVVEAGYDLSVDRSTWLERLLDTAMPLMDRGVGVNAQTFQVSATRFSLEDVALRGVGTPQMLREFLENAPPQVIDRVYRQGAPVGSLSEWLFPSDPIAERGFIDGPEHYFVENTPENFQDSLGLIAHTGTGWGVVLTAPLPRPQRMNEQKRQRWSRVAAHLAAGLRLHLKFSGLDLDSERVEAIMTPNGHVEHAREATKSVTVRERLCAAVQQCDRARTRAQRHDADAALDLWEGLIAGRWSLIDHFDSDQRRYVVAVKNDPDMRDPRGLSTRERQVAEFFGMGRHTKEIGYILGLTQSTVGNTLTRAQRKLGMESKTELATFFAPNGMRARLQEIELAGERIAVGVQPLADEDRFVALTEAERRVAIALLRGATYTLIAAERGTAERTIANQAQNIYRKLRVNSRVELGAVLGAV